MKKINFIWIFFLILVLSACQSTPKERSATATSAVTGKSAEAIEIDHEVAAALSELYRTSSAAKAISERATGILVFPDVLKAGFIVGAQYGKGALLRENQTVGYYNTVAASYGLQAGIQGFGYVLFFMNEDALSYIDESAGWEIGVGPSLVVVDAGFGKVLSSTTLKEDIYAFVFDQRGLMAGLGIQGAKITRIDP